MRKHQDVRIAMNECKVKKLVARPQYNEHVIYDENMAAIKFNKTVVHLNKPRYIGMTILDISKLIMYQYHYDYLMPKYPDSKLMFTDTDSFCYWIPTETNIYDDMYEDKERFDFSNYPVGDVYFNDENNLIPGKMKDEMGGDLILEFVGLRSKMYSILNYDGKNKKTAKGIIKQVKNDQITHQDFRNSLFEKKQLLHNGVKIVQNRHKLYTAEVNKVSLSPFNDKKWITRENNVFTSYSFGNTCIS